MKLYLSLLGCLLLLSTLGTTRGTEVTGGTEGTEGTEDGVSSILQLRGYLSTKDTQVVRVTYLAQYSYSVMPSNVKPNPLGWKTSGKYTSVYLHDMIKDAVAHDHHGDRGERQEEQVEVLNYIFDPDTDSFTATIKFSAGTSYALDGMESRFNKFILDMDFLNYGLTSLVTEGDLISTFVQDPEISSAEQEYVSLFVTGLMVLGLVFL